MNKGSAIHRWWKYNVSFKIIFKTTIFTEELKSYFLEQTDNYRVGERNL